MRKQCHKCFSNKIVTKLAQIFSSLIIYGILCGNNMLSTNNHSIKAYFPISTCTTKDDPNTVSKF